MNRSAFATNSIVRLLLPLLVLSAFKLATAAEPIPSNPPIPADAQPRWYKGNLHTHSLWSDGNDFPEMIADWYVAHGYNFLTLSDHNVLSDGVRWMKLAAIEKRNAQEALDKYLARFGPHWVETRGDRALGTLEVRLKPLDEFRALVEERGRFLMIPGEEISDKVDKLPLHLNATNVRDLIAPMGGRDIREAMQANLRAVEEQAKKTGRPMLVHLNHPNFGWAITAEDMAHVLAERFFEVYNGHPGVNNQGDADRAGCEEMWDIANTIRIAQLSAPPLLGVATDDSHTYHAKGNVRPGRGWIMVRARHLTPESLIRAVKKGDFYASSGVTLRDVGYDDKARTLQLDIEPDGDATFTTRFVGTPADFDPASHERKDSKGAPLRTTRKYSDQIGRTLATVEGLHPAYQLTGGELYVRSVVTSSHGAADPSFKGQRKQAWTQPVGWNERLQKRGTPTK